MITLTPAKLYLEGKGRQKLQPLLLSPRSKPLTEEPASLRVIHESPQEVSQEVEVKMRNKRLVLVNEGVHYSLSQYIERQFEAKTRSNVLESLGPTHIRKKACQSAKTSPRCRLRLT